jgi:hypothetical protein
LEQEKEQFEVGVENRFIYEEGAEEIGRGGNCFAKQTGERVMREELSGNQGIRRLGIGGLGIGKNESGDSRVESSTQLSLRRLKPPAISLAISPAIPPRGSRLKQATPVRSAGASAGEERDWNFWKKIGTNGGAYNEGTRGLRLGFWGIRCLQRIREG